MKRVGVGSALLSVMTQFLGGVIYTVSRFSLLKGNDLSLLLTVPAWKAAPEHHTPGLCHALIWLMTLGGNPARVPASPFSVLGICLLEAYSLSPLWWSLLPVEQSYRTEPHKCRLVPVSNTRVGLILGFILGGLLGCKYNAYSPTPALLQKWKVIFWLVPILLIVSLSVQNSRRDGYKLWSTPESTPTSLHFSSSSNLASDLTLNTTHSSQ